MTKAAYGIKHPHRAIWAIAGPAIIANSSAPLVGLVDTWAIGHLPDQKYLAAIAVGATVFSFIYWAFGFLRMGTTGHAAQAYGRDDQDALAMLIFRSSILGIIIASMLMILQKPILEIGLWLLEPPDTVSPYVVRYFDIRIWSAPASLLIFTINGYLIGTAQAKSALILQLFLNIANAGFNLLFVIGLEMDVEGVALGTLIAEYLAVGLGVILMQKNLPFQDIYRRAKHEASWRWAGFKALLSTNLFLFLRTLFLILALSLITRDAGQFGSGYLAASQVMSTFFMLISLGLDGFAYAAEALAGAAYGRRQRHEFEHWVRYGFLWASVAALLYSLAFYLSGALIIDLITDIEAVRLATKEALPGIILLPLAAVLCFQFDGIFIGATASRAMMITMAAALILFVLIKGYFTDQLGFLGLWLAVNIFMLARGVGLWLAYSGIKRPLG